MQKIVFVMPSLEIGGIEKALLALLPYIDHQTYEVELALQRDDLNLFLDEVAPQVRVNFFARYRSRPLRAIYHWVHRTYQRNALPLPLRFVRALLNRFDRLHTAHCCRTNIVGCDIAIAFHQAYSIPRYVLDCAHARRKVMWYHGNAVDEATALQMQRADLVVAASHEIRGTILSTTSGLEHKVETVRNCIDVALVRRLGAVPYPSLGAPEEFLLCSCGRFVPEKGFDLAIRTAGLLRDAGVPFRWLLVGDGPERARLLSLIDAMGLRAHVLLPGATANPYPFFKAATLFVQPSYAETYGLTIAEAQILGKAVVSTDTVGGKTLVQDGETGRLCAATEQSLAEAIQALLDAPETRLTMERNAAQIDYQQHNRQSGRQCNQLFARLCGE